MLLESSFPIAPRVSCRTAPSPFVQAVRKRTSARDNELRSLSGREPRRSTAAPLRSISNACPIPKDTRKFSPGPETSVPATAVPGLPVPFRARKWRGAEPASCAPTLPSQRGPPKRSDGARREGTEGRQGTAPASHGRPFPAGIRPRTACARPPPPDRSHLTRSAPHSTRAATARHSHRRTLRRGTLRSHSATGQPPPPPHWLLVTCPASLRQSAARAAFGNFSLFSNRARADPAPRHPAPPRPSRESRAFRLGRHLPPFHAAVISNVCRFSLEML